MNNGIRELEEDAMLWRYMDFTKFVSLLDSSSLTFCQASRFEDPYECLPSPSIIQRLNAPESEGGAGEAGKKFLQYFFRFIRESVYISCWHQNEVESDAMWKLYLSSSEGIAIKTNYATLRREVLNGTSTKASGSFTGRVVYDELDSYNDYIKNPIVPFFAKRVSFVHEREVRAVIMSRSTRDFQDKYHQEKKYEDCWNNQPPIWHVQIKLRELIKEVHVAPTAQDWFVELVKNILKKYGLKDIPVFHSKLLTAPDFFQA